MISKKVSVFRMKDIDRNKIFDFISKNRIKNRNRITYSSRPIGGRRTSANGGLLVTSSSNDEVVFSSSSCGKADAAARRAVGMAQAPVLIQKNVRSPTTWRTVAE